jgi:hypothetical protein
MPAPSVVKVSARSTTSTRAPARDKARAAAKPAIPAPEINKVCDMAPDCQPSDAGRHKPTFEGWTTQQAQAL